MSAEWLVVFLEEPSAKRMLDVIIPKLLPEGMSFKCIPFEGKSDLEKQVSSKMRGWKKPNSVFLVMRDQDAGDCKVVKKRLLDLCAASFCNENQYLVRIACHELESFYLGDLDAVRSAGFKVTLTKKFKNGYKEPDLIASPAEELSKITSGEYQKIAGSAAIAPYLKLDGTNASKSFNVLVDGIRKLVQ